MENNLETKIIKRKPRLSLKQKEAITGWVFVAPLLIGFLVFTAFSMFYSLYISFTDWNILSSPKWVGFNNYVQIFTKDNYFWDNLYNTFYYVIVLVPVVTVISLFFALILNKKTKQSFLYRAILFLPCVVSTVAIAVVWRWLFNSDRGVINGILMMIGIENPPKWLLSARHAKNAIIIMRVWQMTGYYMMFYLTGLQTIPDTVYEAATVDGAGKFKQFWYITLPLLRPTTFVLTILLVLEAFNIFEVVVVMTEGAMGTSSLMYYIYSLGFESYKMGYASSLAWVMFILILGFTILRFVLKKDETM